MISHRHRCIFIHIPRTAGTSIEKWMVGEDWWNVEPESKHLLASQAKERYAEFWDDYWKFSIVRNPWDRFVSLAKYRRYGVDLKNGKLDISRYIDLFGSPLTIEHDVRFSTRRSVKHANHIEGCVYGNILDETLDFIGFFEDLPSVVAAVQMNVDDPPDGYPPHMERSKERVRRYTKYYTTSVWNQVSDLHAVDCPLYGYPNWVTAIPDSAKL